MISWRKILELNRTDNFKHRNFDLCACWRALAYREHAGEPPPLVQAWGFQYVLDHLAIELDGGPILGSCRGFTGDTLPAGLDSVEYHNYLSESRAAQRDFWAGFDHSLADMPTLLALGLGGCREQVRESLRVHTASEELVFLQAVERTLEAFSAYIQRISETARAKNDPDGARVCASLVESPPRNFREAIQLTWLIHLAFKSEGRCHMALGRIDQYLWPFYQRDCAAGLLSRAEALEFLCHLWARLDEIGEVQNICIGGLTPQGADATNELSALCLEATRLVQSPHTNLSARFHDQTPETFHRACFEVIRTGLGFPAIFNDHVLLPGLTEIGIPLDAARDYCMVGCIETMLPGRQPPWSDSRFNTPLLLLRSLERMAGEETISYQRLVDLFREELSQGIAAHVEQINRHIERFPAAEFPDPFLSAFTRDCIGRARDVNAGGAQFPRFHGIAIMGLATLADSLAALKKLVFEEESIPYPALMAALQDNFAGAEALRQRLLNKAPKYGNDDPGVDQIAADIVQWTADECLKHRISGGGRFVSAMAANIQNISAGKEVGATPDGRKAFTPLSDAASPHFGRDEHGPTAFLRSVSVPDYHRVLTGTVINMRFDPNFYEDEEGAQRFLSFTRYFVTQRIPELQFNFTDNATLLAARLEPEKYRDLIVRVSGFSARFVELAPEVQDDITRRRAHGRANS